MRQLLRFCLAPLLVLLVSSAAAQPVHWSVRSGTLIDGATTLSVTRKGVLIASGRTGFWISTDEGQSWHHRLDSIAVAFGVVPIGDTLLWLDKDIHYSTDYGITWTLLQTLNQGARTALADSLGDILLYNGLLIRHSSNFGRTWETDTATTAIVPVRFGPSRLLWARGPGRFFVSTDFGVTWQTRGSREPVGWDGAGVYYARSNDTIFASEDTGRTWRYTAVSPAGAFHVLPSGAFWTISEGSDSELHHVARSTDHGKTWTDMPLPRGKYDNGTALELAGQFYLGSEDGVFRSTDSGRTWSQPNRPITESRGYLYGPVDICADSNGRIYAINGNGVWRTSDGGNNWSLLNAYRDGARGPQTSSPWQNSLVAQGDRIYCANHHSVFRVDSTSNPWQKLTPDSLEDYFKLVIDGNGSLYAFCAQSLSTCVYRSSDEGVHWQDLAPKDVRLTSIAVSLDGTVLAAAEEGVQALDPRILRWSPLSHAWVRVGSGVVMAIGSKDDRFYYVTQDSVLHRSFDDGTTFDSIRLPFAPLRYSPMTFDSSGGVLMMSDGGLIRSADDGQSWQEINDGLFDLTNFPSICVDRYGYGWFISGLVYRTDEPLSKTAGKVEITPKNRAAISLLRNGQICRFEGAAGDTYSVAVYNAVGECIRTLSARPSIELPKDCHGLYFLVVSAGTARQVFKLIL